jgi:hypothetical protein
VEGNRCPFQRGHNEAARLSLRIAAIAGTPGRVKLEQEGFMNWLVVAICLAIALLMPELGGRWFRSIENIFSRIAARRSAAILMIFGATIGLRLLLLPLIPVPVPGVHDEFSYLLQADTFAHWRLANPPHPMWVSLETFHINSFPTYSSMFPPAQSFVLALGQLAGHPWIGVLLSCATMVAAIVWMLQGWMPPRWALLGGIVALLRLGITSYWMNSYWGGATAAAGGALVAGAIPRIRRKPRFQDALLLGLGVAILANSRPLEGLIFCIPAAGVLLVWLWKNSKVPRKVKMRRVVAPVLAILVLTGAFTLYYDWRLTGNAFLLPHVLNSRNYIPLGLFLWEKPGPPRQYRNLEMMEFYNGVVRSSYDRSWEGVKRVSGMKLEAYEDGFLWTGAIPLLIFAPFVFRDRRIRFLILTFVLAGLGLFLVIWSLPHYAAPVVCVLYALVIQSLRHLRTFRSGGRRVGLGLSRMIFLLLLATTATCLYDRIQHPGWGWNGDMGIWERAEIGKQLEEKPGKQLAIVRYGVNHEVGEEWVYNGADIDGSKVVWAREMDPEQNLKLLNYYHDRKAWLIEPEGDSEQMRPYVPGEAPPVLLRKP